MKGTTPKGADVPDWIPAVDEFWQAQGNDALEDFNYAAEAYDAAIVIKLPSRPPVPTVRPTPSRSSASRSVARSA